MEVIALLKSRNRCLQRFLDITREFLASADRGDFGGLERFLASRDRILKALDLYDHKITRIINALNDREKRRSLAAAVQPLVEAREQLIRDIFLVDREISARIDSEKLRVAGEMGATRRSRQNMNKFKSGWVAEAGEGIDTKL